MTETALTIEEQNLEAFSKEMDAVYLTKIQNLFGDEKKAMKFLGAWRHSLSTIPELLTCSKDSMVAAFMKCAELNLYPSQASGEVYVLPYAGKAQFQLGYQGIVTLLGRAGISVSAHIIYANDTFEYEEGVNSKLLHKPDIFSENRGEAIGAYAVATLSNGHKQFCVLGRATIMKFKEFSKAKASQYSPWNGTDPELWMWKKTCIKQLSKTLTKTEQINEAITEDNEGDDIHLPTAEKAGELMAGITPIPHD